MIDLGCTRARLLAEIEGTNSTGEPLSDITDPRVATADAHVRVCGRGRKDLFPLLKIALCERFASVPRPQLIRDLLMPLKNALGNAFKHGNGSDLGKRVSVEIMLTRKGALLAVTDEGTGFDFARTFRRFQQQETYFENHGCGFRNLHQAMSTVTYENGGRTVLLCFRPTKESLEPASRWPALEPVAVGNSPAVERSVPPGGKHGEAFKRAETTDLIPGGKMLPSTAGETPAATFWRAPCAKNSESSLAKLLDGEWMRTSLSTELPEFANGGARLESCRIYPTGGRFDANLNKSVKVSETKTIQFRVDALDVLNHPDPATPIVDINAAQLRHEPIGDARWDTPHHEVVDALLTPAADDVVAFFQFFQEERDIVGIVLQVAIHRDDVLAPGIVESGS